MLAVTFRNISDLADVSDYEYEVLVGGGGRTWLITTGHVRGHRRADGWEVLVKKLLTDREQQVKEIARLREQGGHP